MVPVCPGYGIKERLGEGGFGTVYRAERKKDRRVWSSDLPQLITSQVYAIKVVKLSAGMSNLDLLEEEIYALSQLFHPNVVSFIEVVEHKSVKHVLWWNTAEEAISGCFSISTWNCGASHCC
jgi:serine/threonine protein kinase